MTQLHFAPEQNYDCVMCAKGCSESWQVHVNPSAYNAVKGTEKGRLLEQRVIQRAGDGPLEVFPETPDGIVVGRVAGNRCVFLADDKLCDIHREMGICSKPISCRQFPFTCVHTPDGIFVGLTYFCTSAQQNSGRPLPEHEAEVRAILEGVILTPIGVQPFLVAQGLTLDWPTYKLVEARFREDLASLGPKLAFSKLFRVLSRAVREIGSGAITEENLQALWRSIPADDLAADPFLSDQLDLFLGSLMGVTEFGKDLAHRQLCEAYLEGRTHGVPHAGGEVDFGVIRARTEAIEQQFKAEILRYFGGLVHRKFLIDKRPMLDNVMLGYLLRGFLLTYTAIFAERRQPGGAAEIQDYYHALDLLEADVVTHAGGLEKLIAIYADGIHRCLCLD